MGLPLELLELTLGHLYPKFSLSCFEASQRNTRWKVMKIVLLPSSGSWVADHAAKHLAQSREWKAPVNASFQSVLRIKFLSSQHLLDGSTD